MRVPRTVVLLGFTSMLTDISSEMVVAVLPLYLVFGLGLSPLQFGVVDGLHQGASALVRVFGGFAGDRRRRHKEVAIVGYGLSAASRLALPLVGSAFASLTAVVMVDRVGKGIRTAPRDALISLSSSRAGLATAFSVHRAMDTAGAMLGPLVAFALLAVAPDAFDAVFVVSFCFALLGLGVLALFVSNPSPETETEPETESQPASSSAGPERPTVRSAVALLRGRRLIVLIGIGAAFSLATVTDGFIYLALQAQLDFAAELLPLLYFGTALAYMLLAIPAGLVADRFGRLRVFLAGYGLLLSLYLLLLVPAGGVVKLVVCLGLLGGYYAGTEGVLMAIASALLPASLRGTGLALLVTATSVARIVAAIAFGAVWASAGAHTALVSFAIALVVVLAASAMAMVYLREDHDAEIARA